TVATRVTCAAIAATNARPAMLPAAPASAISATAVARTGVGNNSVAAAVPPTIKPLVAAPNTAKPAASQSTGHRYPLGGPRKQNSIASATSAPNAATVHTRPTRSHAIAPSGNPPSAVTPANRNAPLAISGESPA